ncbi:MAG TPA: hypothetical protein VGD10_05880 [Allosphingosinicella sp.]|uniref:hypothetical protein n=1 Tax=Allosphingosinicella sp. TaxID=2823234 RepID=UPI002ED7BED9
MIARGFKPVGWVAAVGGAALGCYMLSLNVASERAELAQIERQIIAAKQDIRQLQTELGTRGRLTQLEHWNAEVLALSAPGSQQFLSDELRLASFTQPVQSTDQTISNVRMASADAAAPEAKLKTAVGIGFEAPEAAPAKPMLRQASLVATAAPAAEKRPAFIKAAAVVETPVVKKAAAKAPLAKTEPVKKAVEVKKPAVQKAATVQKTAAAKPKKPAMIDDDLIAAVSDAAKAEKKAGGAGR